MYAVYDVMRYFHWCAAFFLVVFLALDLLLGLALPLGAADISSSAPRAGTA